LLYQHGEFDERAVQIVSWALFWYAAGLVGHSIMEILARAFYAQNDTKTPVIIGAVAMGLNIVFSVMFIKLFEYLGWMPHGGLALANSLATAIEAVTLFVVMRKRLNGIEGNFIMHGVIPSAIATFVMSICIFGWLYIGEGLSLWILIPVGVMVGIGVYLAGLWVFRVPELNYLVSGILRRMKSS